MSTLSAHSASRRTISRSIATIIGDAVPERRGPRKEWKSQHLLTSITRMATSSSPKIQMMEGQIGILKWRMKNHFIQTNILRVWAKKTRKVHLSRNSLHRILTCIPASSMKAGRKRWSPPKNEIKDWREPPLVFLVNVRGLNPDKLNLISEHFTRERLDFVCLQETMVSNKDSINDLSKKWNGPSFWSPAIGRRGGVVILV